MVEQICSGRPALCIHPGHISHNDPGSIGMGRSPDWSSRICYSYDECNLMGFHSIRNPWSIRNHYDPADDPGMHRNPLDPGSMCRQYCGLRMII